MRACLDARRCCPVIMYCGEKLRVIPSLVGMALIQNTALLLHEMDEHDARKAVKGEHSVGAPSAVFDGADVTFNVWNMLVRGGCI